MMGTSMVNPSVASWPLRFGALVLIRDARQRLNLPAVAMPNKPGRTAVVWCP